MNSLLFKWFVFVLMLAPAPNLYSQAILKISADKDHLLVGETVKLTIEARLPLGEKIKWINLDSIPHFEWIDKGKQDIIDGLDGKKIQQVVSVTSYDTGYWIIPRMNIKIASKTYSTDTIGIRVDYNTGFNPAEDYRDIKANEEVESTENLFNRWLIIGGSLLLLLIILFFYFKKSKKQPVKDTNQRSPYEEAMEGLALLKKKTPTTDIEVKLYYTRLNDVFRNYIFKQFKWATLEKTNDELVVQLNQLNLPKEQFTLLAQSLRMADYVKFAKYLPPVNENEKSLSVIESSIISLNKSSN